MIKRLTLLLLLAGIGSLFAGLVLTYVPDETLNLTASYYAERTAEDLGAANIVTAIIVTYRGLDTLGEVTVLFLTAAIVGLVLVRSRQPGKAQPRNKPASGELLITGSRLLVPLILLLGVHVFINGHLTPGGGFQGGAILASGMLLMLLSHPLRRFGHRMISIVESISGIAFVTVHMLRSGRHGTS